jgi:hypothetical protein
MKFLIPIFFLVLICFKQITSGIKHSGQHDEDLDNSANGLKGESGYSNMLNSKQESKNVFKDEVARRNAGSITHKNKPLHYLNKHFKSIRRNDKEWLKHNFMPQHHKRHNKYRKEFISHIVRNSYHTRGHRRHLKKFQRNVFPKNTRRNKNSESQNFINKERLLKKFRHQTLKEKRKELRERDNFHSKSDYSKLIRSHLENKCKMKDHHRIMYSKPRRKQNHSKFQNKGPFIRAKIGRGLNRPRLK